MVLEIATSRISVAKFLSCEASTSASTVWTAQLPRSTGALVTSASAYCSTLFVRQLVNAPFAASWC